MRGPSPYSHLNEAEKEALLLEQAALIARLVERIAALEALVGQPRKTSSNAHTPPSQDGPGGKPNKPEKKKRRKPRPSRPGVGRKLTPSPDRTERCLATVCPHCETAVTAGAQRCRHRYDHIELPEVRPVVTRVELFGGRCRGCGRRYRSDPPAAMPPGTPFGPRIRALMTYLHHSHHIGFERLARLAGELFGLRISEGAITNLFRRLQAPFTTACAAIKARLLEASVIASDETTTRVNGKTHWQWVFHSPDAVLHTIVPSRARAVAAELLGDHQPEIWISDRYAGQQELGQKHQVCLAHVLRDVQYAIDCGDSILAPKIRDHLRWTIRIGKRRPKLKDTTLAAYAAEAERRLDRLLAGPAAHPAGRELQRQIKAWRSKFFVFLNDRRVPPTNNESEREVRPSVTFRKVTNGFRSLWGPSIHAGYRSVTGTARRKGKTQWEAIHDLVNGAFALA